MKPTIQATSFGSITIEGQTFRHDVVLHLDGAVTKRDKKLSKQVHGTSHMISLAEARHLYEEGAERLIIGTGRFNSVRLSDEAKAYLEEHHCVATLAPTRAAIRLWNESAGRATGLFHVTC